MTTTDAPSSLSRFVCPVSPLTFVRDQWRFFRKVQTVKDSNPWMFMLIHGFQTEAVSDKGNGMAFPKYFHSFPNSGSVSI